MSVSGLMGCMPQDQGEIEQLRAELQAAQTELTALKAQQQQAQAEQTEIAAAPPSDAPAAEPATAAPVAPPAPAVPPFEEALSAFEAEKRDKEWAFKREGGLLEAAKTHIRGNGASVNSVMCKSTACQVVIDVPAKPKTPYVAMGNPWADTAMSTGQKEIYGGKIRWTYLLQRHGQDDPKLGEQRVDPLALAKQRKQADEPAKTPEAATAAAPAKAPAKPKDPPPATRPPPPANPATTTGSEPASAPQPVSNPETAAPKQ